MRLYICSVEELADAASFDAASLRIDETRRENLKRLKNPADVRRSVGAGLLLAYAFHLYQSRPREFFGDSGSSGLHPEALSMEQLLAVPPQNFCYRKTPAGKPYLEGEKDFFFSLSHSGSYALCAGAPMEIGADIQLMERFPRETLAERIMTPGEYEAYKLLPDPEKKQQFYRIWACKESCCKLTGKGLTQDFRGMEIDAGRGVISMRREGRTACFRTFVWKENYRIAVSFLQERSILRTDLRFRRAESWGLE